MAWTECPKCGARMSTNKNTHSEASCHRRIVEQTAKEIKAEQRANGFVEAHPHAVLLRNAGVEMRRVYAGYAVDGQLAQIWFAPVWAVYIAADRALQPYARKALIKKFHEDKRAVDSVLSTYRLGGCEAMCEFVDNYFQGELYREL